MRITRRTTNIGKKLLLPTIAQFLKNRARLMKCIKDRFGRIKNRVAMFCGSWKEANALWASGEFDVDLMDRAQKFMKRSIKKMAHLCLNIAGRFFARSQNGMPI
jgi:hypothetical protein